MEKLNKSFLLKGILICITAIVIAGLTISASEQKVTLSEDNETYILDNGIVTARIAKASGDLVSLRFRDMEMLGTFLTPDGEPDLKKDPPGANPDGLNKGMTDHQYGFWSHDAMGPKGTIPAVASVTINPKKNGGRRGEVSIKGVSGGRKMGTGPGSRQDGQFISDIEIRYTMGRGESGVYTYCIFEHKPEYPFTMLGEARFCAKLADFFDWMSIDESCNFYYPKELKTGDKYIYTRVQSKNPAFGWSSTKMNVGFFIINPSMEYMSGGPTKVEFMGHRDTNPVAAPCVLNYWRSSHYGGAEVNVEAGEHWTKVIGPFLIYVNSGTNPEEIYADAKAQAANEAAKWPFAWVNAAEYTPEKERSAVKGRLILKDEASPSELSNLTVGLTAPAYVSPRPEGANTELITDWQRDAKYYQFWCKGERSGSFEIKNVRPGKYTLHAFADGVLGEYFMTDVIVKPGSTLDLGNIDWTPVRKGRQLWDIGIPNRNASEFFMAESYSDPEIPLKYAVLFPNDITYKTGTSSFNKDWFFQHVPHNEDPEAKPSPFFGIRSAGRATPYTILFEMPDEPKGKAVLRFAICGNAAPSIDIAFNGLPAGKLENLFNDGIIARHGSHGIWNEREVVFDAGILRKGTNKLVITVPAGPVNNGIMYDYLRLEMDESGIGR